jgi:enoyl-CoA hydratase
MKNIILDRKNGISILTINRPGFKNALDGRTYDEFALAVDKVKNDTGTRVLVITGVENSFCSGIDLAYAKALTELSQIEFMAMMKKVQATFMFENLSIPVIAAVNGYALGNGCDIALAADFIYAAESAVFSMAYTNVGMIPDLGGTFRLTRLVGPSIAKELILTGDRFTASRALEIRMISRVLPDAELMGSVMSFSEKLAKRAPIAMSMAKRSINNSLSADLAATLDFEAYNQSLCIKSADSSEAVAAMMEKRKPLFCGR